MSSFSLGLLPYQCFSRAQVPLCLSRAQGGIFVLRGVLEVESFRPRAQGQLSGAEEPVRGALSFDVPIRMVKLCDRV
ncbi:MAG: hypothetical protein ACXIUW_11420 [Roseinatronobacter sp.]